MLTLSTLCQEFPAGEQVNPAAWNAPWDVWVGGLDPGGRVGKKCQLSFPAFPDKSSLASWTKSAHQRDWEGPFE